MKIRSNLAVSEDGFVFDSATGESFTTNEIGVEIIDQLKKDIKREELINNLCDIYDADKLIIEKSVDEFLITLKELNLVDND